MNHNVVAVRVKGVMPTSNGCAVFLGSDSKTYLIYMERSIGEAIQSAINNQQTERPMTHELIINLLNGLGAQVERVIINAVEKDTFFARLIVSMKNELGHKIIEIDARPSDSIMFALISKKPIFTAQKVLEAVDDITDVLEKILNTDE